MFHKEGFNIIVFNFLMSTSLVISFEILINSENIKSFIQILILIQFLLILWFFRNPIRNIKINPELILSPADGKIVVIKEVTETEFFNDKRKQVSIFLSPLDIHVNRYPVSGKIIFSKYHKGKYLVAWHPKSSDKNERTTIVIDNKKFGEVMYRQIAGAVARRIINYAKPNKKVIQGDDSGFIKFGSRVDLLLPIECKIRVKIGQKVKGGITEIV